MSTPDTTQPAAGEGQGVSITGARLRHFADIVSVDRQILRDEGLAGRARAEREALESGYTYTMGNMDEVAAAETIDAAVEAVESFVAARMNEEERRSARITTLLAREAVLYHALNIFEAYKTHLLTRIVSAQQNVAEMLGRGELTPAEAEQLGMRLESLISHAPSAEPEPEPEAAPAPSAAEPADRTDSEAAGEENPAVPAIWRPAAEAITGANELYGVKGDIVWRLVDEFQGRHFTLNDLYEAMLRVDPRTSKATLTNYFSALRALLPQMVFEGRQIMVVPVGKAGKAAIYSLQINDVAGITDEPADPVGTPEGNSGRENGSFLSSREYFSLNLALHFVLDEGEPALADLLALQAMIGERRGNRLYLLSSQDIITEIEHAIGRLREADDTQLNDGERLMRDAFSRIQEGGQNAEATFLLQTLRTLRDLADQLVEERALEREGGRSYIIDEQPNA